MTNKEKDKQQKNTIQEKQQNMLKFRQTNLHAKKRTDRKKKSTS